jgi:hypothetical protein
MPVASMLFLHRLAWQNSRANPIPITGLYTFFTLPFENSANTYLKNPQSYSYQSQTGSKVVTYSPLPGDK